MANTAELREITASRPLGSDKTETKRGEIQKFDIIDVLLVIFDFPGEPNA